jgi:hypothetical protein
VQYGVSDADAVPDGHERRDFRGQEQVLQVCCHGGIGRNERQVKQWLIKGTPGTTKDKIVNCQIVAFFDSRWMKKTNYIAYRVP